MRRTNALSTSQLQNRIYHRTATFVLHLLEQRNQKDKPKRKSLTGSLNNQHNLTLYIPKKFHSNCTIGVQWTPDFKKAFSRKRLLQINQLTLKTAKKQTF